MDNVGYQYATTVLHRGIVFVFTAGADPTSDDLYYNVLDLEIASSDDALDWSGFRKLDFAKELRTVGMGMVTVPMSEDTTGGVAHGQFKVLSDQKYVYVFRRSNRKTLYCNRYSMTEARGERDSDQTVRTLEPAWEVRFQRSGKRDIAASDRDVASYKNPTGDYFVEPTLELSMVENIDDGGFSVLLVPAQSSDRPRWQIFSHDSKAGCISMFSFARDESGLFDVVGKQVDPTRKTILPDRQFALSCSTDDTAVPMDVVTGLEATVYYKQEPATAADGKTVGLKRSGRVLLAAGVLPRGAAPEAGSTATIDFAIARDGTLAQIEKETVLGEVEPAGHTLYFGDGSSIDLTDNQSALSLSGSFTLEAWLQPDGIDDTARVVLGGSQAAPAAETAPFIRVLNGFVETGFAEVKLSTPVSVLQSGVWNQVAITFDASSGALTVYVNGALIASKTFQGKNPPGKPVSIMGAAANAALPPFHGGLDEVRIWKTARSLPQIVATLYTEIEDPDQEPDLVGYWSFDHVAHSGGVITVPDLSRYGNAGTLHGPQVQATTSPVAAATSAVLQVDGNGLTIEAGYLPFATPASTPFLLDGSDGLVHLYFQSRDDVFSVAQYDAAIARAIYYVPWTTQAATPGDGQAQAMALVAHRAGTLMNGCAVVVTPATAETGTATVTRADLCTLQMTTRTNAGETWRGVPRSLMRCIEVLTGRASGDPSDPKLRSGETHFFDYGGNHKSSWLEATAGHMLITTRRPAKDEQGVVDPDGLDLASVDIVQAGAGQPATLTMRFAPADGGPAIEQAWPQVPLAVDAFTSVLTGLSTGYPYAAARTGMPIYSLSAGASRLLLLARTTAITKATIRVAAGATTSTCDLALELVVDGETLSFAAKGVERLQNDVTQALRDCTTAAGQKLTDTLFISCDGLTTDVSDQEHIYEGTTDGLQAATALFSVIVDGAIGEIAAKRSDALFLQGADSSDPNTDLSDGSALFGAAAASVPVSGQVAMLSDIAQAPLWQPGVDGGWLAEPQRFAVAFNSNAAVVDISNPTKAQVLHIRGDLSMEAWVDPNGTASSTCPRIVSYNQAGDPLAVDDVACYMLGCLESQYLQVTASNATGTRIELSNADGAFGLGAYTVQAWLQPNLSTIGSNLQVLWSRVSGDGFERLTLDQAGILTFTLEKNGAASSLNSNIALLSQTWSQVSLARAGGSLTLYVDGNACGTLVVPAPVPATQFVVAGNNGPGNLIQFGLNELRVWSRALGAGEIAANMNAQLPADAEGLQLRWPLSSDADGDVAKNTAQTGSAFDGRIGNTRTWRLPGVFYSAYAGSRRKAVRSSAAVVPRANWTHLAAVYDTANALQFSQAAYGDAGNDASFDFDQDFGIDLWVTPDTAGSTATEALVSKWSDQADGQSWELGIAAGGCPYMRVRLVAGKDVLDLTALTQLPIVSGVPHHIAATLDTTVVTKVVSAGTANVPATGDKPGEIEANQVITVTVFVDGKRAGSAQSTIKDGQYALARSATAVQLARTRPDATGPNAAYLHAAYSGAMSNVRLWNKALVEADAATLSRPEAAVSSDGLAAWWPFSEMDGNVAFDQAGANNVRLTRNDLWRLYDANAALRLYVNGDPIPVDEFLPEAFGGYGEQQFRLGGMRAENSFTQGWTGSVDEIRLWNTNLTQEQITDSMSRPLAGNEEHLAGYWRFDAGSGVTVADWTGRGNDAVLERGSTGAYPAWVVSTAPVNNEGPAVHNVLGGLRTPESARVTSAPAAVDYPDVQRDATGQMFSVIKRLYVAPRDLGIGLQTGFKLGDLDSTYVGQVQTNPKLIGFIEGAPPLPSENQSRPFYVDPHVSDFLYYEQASKVTIEQEEESVRAYSSTKQSGFDLDTEVKAGLYMINQVKGGSPFLHADMVDLEGHIGVHATFAFSTSTETGQELQGNRTRTFSNAIGCGGEWEEKGPPAPGNPDGWLNPLVGRRFMPDNIGFALVKSMTADMYAQTLKTTGALVALTLVPNQEIPEDINILTFPIRPRYTKNGTLDGKIGLVNDPSYLDANLERGSYFKPVEAYAQKRRIERQSKQLEAYWEQFDATGRGQAGNAGLDQVRDDDPYYDWKAGVSRKGMVNSYVWSAGGGLYKDEEQYGTTYGESHSGSYEFKGMAGLMGDGMGAFFGMGFYAEVDFLVGGHLEVTVLKKSEDSRSFGLEVELDADSFLKRYLGDASPEPFSRSVCPGKVDGYRFMTFYLPPDRSNAEQFQNVVDDVWLARSDEPAAVSLRQLAYDENGVWRIFHRVTYVSRIPPEFQPVPDESQAPPQREPANIGDNLELIRLVQLALGKAEPTPLNIGKAVNTVLDTTLAATLPWWPAFQQAALAFRSDAQRTLQALREDLLEYMNEAYATVLKDKPAS
ncbi:MAG TPA: LamG domain-containing protein [Lysobacter sp.]